jgi:hypothetical protein
MLLIRKIKNDRSCDPLESGRKNLLASKNQEIAEDVGSYRALTTLY